MGTAEPERAGPSLPGGPARRVGARGLILRVAAALAALAGVVLLGRAVGGYLPEFADWVQARGAWGPVVFVAGYALATVAFVPGSLLTLAAGAIFGIVAGVAYVFVGAVIGSSLAFLVSRYLARPAVERWVGGDARFARIDRAIAREGRRMVFLLRLSPVLPFNLLNYALGLTRVRFVDYVVASVAMLPGTLLYVYSGHVVGSLAALAGGAAVERGAGYWAVLALGLLATAVVTVWITRIARRALHQEDVDEPDR